MAGPLLGAVLAGGASRRMGQPKAVMEVDGRPLAARAVAALRRAGAVEVVLVGGDPAWAPLVGADGHLPDQRAHTGPVGGLDAALAWAHARAESSVLVVVAADQPALQPATISALAEAVAVRPDPHDPSSGPRAAMGCTPDGFHQPFPSAWRAEGTAAVRELLDAGERRLVQVAAALGAALVPVSEGEVVDLDRPEDVRAWLARRPPP